MFSSNLWQWCKTSSLLSQAAKINLVKSLDLFWLVEFYLLPGTYDVHIENLIAPHSLRSTRLLNHEHVGVLSESFQENSLGHYVILVGMLTSETVNPVELRNDGCCKVEVLGGNHTRQALQSLHERGTLTNPLVKVNVYRPLPVTAALAIGYQHNTLLQEKRRPLQFIEKVRLMRYCRPSENMSKDEVTHWKDMLVVIFRTKVGRKGKYTTSELLKEKNKPRYHMF